MTAYTLFLIEQFELKAEKLFEAQDDAAAIQIAGRMIDSLHSFGLYSKIPNGLSAVKDGWWKAGWQDSWENTIDHSFTYCGAVWGTPVELPDLRDAEQLPIVKKLLEVASQTKKAEES